MAAVSSSSKLLTLRSRVLQTIVRGNLLRDASPAAGILPLLNAGSVNPTFPDLQPVHGMPLEKNDASELFWPKAMNLQRNVVSAAQIEALRTYVPNPGESEDDWDDDEESDEDPCSNTLEGEDDDGDDEWDDIDSDEGEPCSPASKKK